MPHSFAVHTILGNLVKADRHDAALGLFGSLYRIVALDGRATTLFGQHMFEHFLPQDVSAAAAALGSDLVRVLCQMLDAALRIDRRVSDDPPADYSHHMSRTISEHGTKHGVVDALVGEIVRAVRLIPRHTRTGSSRSSPRSPDILGGCSPVCGFYPLPQSRSHPALATSSLDDTDLVGETWCNLEYGELAAAWFDRLPEETRARILSAVDKVPSKYEPTWQERFQKARARTH